MADATEGAVLKIGDDIIQPIVRAKIEAAIVEVLGGQGTLIEQVVHAALMQNRDNYGKPCRKGDYGDQGSMLEKIARDEIAEATKDALKAYLTERRPELVKIIKQQMKKHETALAEAYVTGLIGSADGYRLSLSFNVSKIGRD